MKSKCKKIIKIVEKKLQKYKTKISRLEFKYKEIEQ